MALAQSVSSTTSSLVDVTTRNWKEEALVPAKKLELQKLAEEIRVRETKVESGRS